MSTNYKIIGAKAVLGVGLTLKLTDKQASIRKSTLKLKKKGIYVVLEPVEFKQGETIAIVDGAVSKSVLANLEDLSPKSAEYEQKINKVSAKKDNKKSNLTPASKNNDKEIKPDENDDSQDEESAPENKDEKIVNNGNVNNLPVDNKQ